VGKDANISFLRVEERKAYFLKHIGNERSISYDRKEGEKHTFMVLGKQSIYYLS
jgi:hypothetical protein